MDQPLFLVCDLEFTLDCVVERISENTADIHDIHKIKQRSVCHTRKCNAMLCTVQAFTRKHRI